MKFSGYINTSPYAGEIYRVRLDGHMFPFCFGTVYETCLGINLDSDHAPSLNHKFSWGYEGLEPDLLSISMLSVAMGIPFSILQMIDPKARNKTPMASVAHMVDSNYPGSLHYGKPYKDNKPPEYCKDIPAAIKGLFKDFTSEVVANFGPTWEMTTDEILQWINKRNGGLDVRKD